MITLVRTNGQSKPIGAISEVYNAKNSNARVGETVEITDQNRNVLNVARVTGINHVRKVYTIEMVA